MTVHFIGVCDARPQMADEDRAPSGRHINIHFSPEIMAGVYANFANVSHSDYEFTLTFARVVLLEQLFRAHKILKGEPYHH